MCSFDASSRQSGITCLRVHLGLKLVLCWPCCKILWPASAVPGRMGVLASQCTRVPLAADSPHHALTEEQHKLL